MEIGYYLCHPGKQFQNQSGTALLKFMWAFHISYWIDDISNVEYWSFTEFGSVEEVRCDVSDLSNLRNYSLDLFVKILPTSFVNSSLQSYFYVFHLSECHEQ